MNTKIDHKKVLEKDLAINLEATREKEMHISLERLAKIIVKSLGDDTFLLREHLGVELLKQIENKPSMGFKTK